MTSRSNDTRPQMTHSIALLGFSGTGKTTIGEILSDWLGWPLVDLDERIVEVTGMPITDIFAQYGEAHFRDLETRVLLEELDAPPRVIATGGGIVERPENRKHLKAGAVTIALFAKPEEIMRRLAHESDRPLLNTEDRLTKIRNLIQKRTGFYQEADHAIWTDGLTPEGVAREILTCLGVDPFWLDERME